MVSLQSLHWTSTFAATKTEVFPRKQNKREKCETGVHSAQKPGLINSSSLSKDVHSKLPMLLSISKQRRCSEDAALHHCYSTYTALEITAWTMNSETVLLTYEGQSLHIDAPAARRTCQRVARTVSCWTRHFEKALLWLLCIILFTAPANITGLFSTVLHLQQQIITSHLPTCALRIISLNAN